MVRRLPAPARVAALEAALSVAGREESEAFAAELIELAAIGKPHWDGVSGVKRRRRFAAMAPTLSLLRAWPMLNDDAREATLAVAGASLPEAMESLAMSRSFGDRIAAARVAAYRPAPATLPCLARLILDSDEDIASAAEGALSAVADRRDLDDAGLEAMDETLADALMTFADHRRQGVVKASAARADAATGRLARLLLDESLPGLLAVRSHLRRDRRPGTRLGAVRLLDHPTLGNAALSRLSAPASAEEHEATLRDWPLVLHPARQRRLSRLTASVAPLPDHESLAELTADARLGVLSWIDTLPLRAAERSAWVARMVADEDERVSVAAVRRAARLPRPDATAREALLLATGSCTASVSRSAALAILDDRSPAARTWCVGMRESAHKAAREIAADSVRRLDPFAWVRESDPLADALALRRAIRKQGAEAIERLRGFVAKGVTVERIRAIRLAVRAGAADSVGLELMKAASDRDERIAATAALALGYVSTTTGEAALITCLSHPDGRVRASALEAIARRRPEHPLVHRALTDDEPRVRANAVRARLILLGDEAAERDLEAMLSDERAAHRLSALWVVERGGRTRQAGRVGEMSREDASEAVQRRASRCTRRLLAQMRVERPGRRTPAAARLVEEAA